MAAAESTVPAGPESGLEVQIPTGEAEGAKVHPTMSQCI